MAHPNRQQARWSAGIAVGRVLAGLWCLVAAPFAQGVTISAHEITVRNGSGIPVPIAFTVFQPDGTPDQSFPLVLIGHGWGASRVTEIDPVPASLTIVSDSTLVAEAVARGYGVISFDYRGHGGSGGISHLMDPRWEVRDIAAILDWADANLPWLFRIGGDPRIGLLGQSFGAAYHIPLAAQDPRIDAAVSIVTWYDLTEALVPNGVPKSTWLDLLYIAGALATDFKLDPRLSLVLGQSTLANRAGPLLQREFRGHGAALTCGRRVPGPRSIPTLLVQGLNDVLFNLNQAVANRECLERAGADVRLMAVTGGHTIPGLQPPNPEHSACGTLDPVDAGLNWLDEHVKGMDGAAGAIPSVCWNVGPGEATYEYRHGDHFSPLPPSVVAVGIPGQRFAPTHTVTRSQLLAGIPRVRLRLVPIGELSVTRPTIFVGVGIQRFGQTDIQLVQEQVMPVRGGGWHELDLAGIGARLVAGDTVGLVYQGANRFFATSGTRYAEYPVRVTGEIALPLGD